ncbi:ABC transporter ATP-binding protein [Pengzhenrongella sicca]|uniref:ABC transporter ATP-binding protein n=1 Tax=Pengzhenrongella sicca TaxID=2819238 RepID=A0A8A4ZIQ4_9MICO|nr:ABC transporter ATP-binding protein [Pengzhenrongella sicca]
MRPVIEARGVAKEFRGTHALADVSFALEPDRIHGLLGRNGAGKTTLMRILAGQDRPSGGSVAMFGADPFENAAVAQRICFVRESQVYPENFRVGHVLAAARLLYPTWADDVATRLVAAFDLPQDRPVKKLSRGMTSALGIVVGIAARAPITMFDEPYLGLDPAARQVFYDALLADFSAHPRTVVLSTHLIDEVATLLERVVVVHRGRVVLDADADDVRGTAAAVTGPSPRVEQFIAGREVLHREDLGAYAKVTVLGRLTAADRVRARDLDLELAPVSLQQLVIHATAGAR